MSYVGERHRKASAYLHTSNRQGVERERESERERERKRERENEKMRMPMLAGVCVQPF